MSQIELYQSVLQKLGQLPPRELAALNDFLSLLVSRDAAKKTIKNGSLKSKPALGLKRGSGVGIITYMADDFTAPLEDFKDYM